ncbi:DUF2487 family protein [Fervidibacillus halotolerans]|uniref:YpiF family protein n=1 Tax=Fervidibacillus halotolerans TaxID=2980027 RepID=A0A9E8M1D9_9BACI|nr:DUF2487 family protein [Fervidibacillus halotolerans]WAA13753.1 YpiF family protein [Fervidibacillus halotolerans]
MRWTAEEAVVYLQSKEYIDTALIPIISISFDQKGIDSGNDNEWIQRISMEIEKQFKGRILLLPPLSYATSFQKEQRKNWFRLWVESLNNNVFKHLLFIGTEDLWVSVAEEFDCKYFRIPSVPLRHLDDPYKWTMVQNQVKKLLPQIVEMWHND